MTHPDATEVHVHRRRPFATAPMDVVEDERLTRSDRCVLIYLLGLASRPRWVIYVAAVCRALRLSDAGWKACRRRLEAAGYYRAHKSRVDGGRWRWAIEITDTPGDWDDPVAIGCRATDGGAMDRKLPDRHSSTHALLTHPKQQHHAAASSGKEFERRASGIETWTERDREAAEKIENLETPAAIAAAVAARRLENKSTAPGSVRAEIDRQARAAKEAAARDVAVEAFARQKTEKERRRAERAKRPVADLAAFQAALVRSGPFKDAVLHTKYLASGNPATWQPLPEWGLTDTDVAAIRAFIPDQGVDR